MKSLEEFKKDLKKECLNCQTCEMMSVMACQYCKERVCFSCNFIHCAVFSDFGNCKKNLVNDLNRSVDKIMLNAVNKNNI